MIWYKLLKYTVQHQKHLPDEREEILMDQEEEKAREERGQKHQFFFFFFLHNIYVFELKHWRKLFWILNLNASARFDAFNWIVLTHIF